MSLPDRVREACAAIAERASLVAIDTGRLGEIEPGPPPSLDPELHYGEGGPEEVALFVLTLDAINFGSGWFPTLRKEAGRSGYGTVASRLARRFRSDRPWSPDELRALDGPEVAGVLGQEPGHELMALYARALNDLGRFLGAGCALKAIDAARGSAARLAEQLAEAMPFFDDAGFYKRAQIVPSDLALAGVAELEGLDRLTIFADNLVPHVLRMDGVLRYDPGLAARIDAGELIEAGSREEREIRGCAVHACELVTGELGVPPRTLDNWLWNRGQEARYKAVPRHRARTVYY